MLLDMEMRPGKVGPGVEQKVIPRALQHYLAGTHSDGQEAPERTSTVTEETHLMVRSGKKAAREESKRPTNGTAPVLAQRLLFSPKVSFKQFHGKCCVLDTAYYCS